MTEKTLDRAEIDRLWHEHNNHRQQTGRHETRISLVEERMDRHAAVVAKIDDLVTEMQQVNRSIMALELRNEHNTSAWDTVLTKVVPAVTAVAVVVLMLVELTGT